MVPKEVSWTLEAPVKAKVAAAAKEVASEGEEEEVLAAALVRAPVELLIWVALEVSAPAPVKAAHPVDPEASATTADQI